MELAVCQSLLKSVKYAIRVHCSNVHLLNGIPCVMIKQRRELQKSPCTVKLGIKELLNKEQIGFKELFTDYQLFYTINLLLNKELLPI